MKTLLLKVTCGLLLVAIIACAVYSCKNDTTETYVYEDDIKVELTDDAVNVMIYYYDQAEQNIDAM